MTTTKPKGKELIRWCCNCGCESELVLINQVGTYKDKQIWTAVCGTCLNPFSNTLFGVSEVLI